MDTHISIQRYKKFIKHNRQNVFFYCSRPVKVVTVSALTTVEREFAALTTADDAVNLAFKLSGRVVDIPVAKGQFVKRGELLAELDSRDVELQVSASKAAYTEAQSRLERARRLLQHDAISLQEVESLESGAAQALTAYENALDLLADTRILENAAETPLVSDFLF